MGGHPKTHEPTEHGAPAVEPPPMAQAPPRLALVATWGRWGAGIGALAVGLGATIEGYHEWTHSRRPLAYFAELALLVLA
ncbi:MAG TPA: hypothetical protein VKU41_20325, partial [Polyangiaceae bacterium]|nr:hypothetical protein [Polyangiaceae bacterium]